jgi:predicted TIM-barrel fold metal-dependent hydrolase
MFRPVATRRAYPVLLLGLLCPAAHGEPALFDAHLHYSAEDARAFTPQEILGILDRNRVARAVVTGTPPDHTKALYGQAPDRIVPFLSVYRTAADKATWHGDGTLPGRVQEALATGPWRGVGELHLFAAQRRSPVFRRIVELAAQRGLVLQVHADPAVIDALYEYAPQARVVWAHGGTYPDPSLIADYLRRYPDLYVDLSVRDERIAPDGEIDPEWTMLLMERSDRFLVGVDTYSTKRWRRFDQVVAGVRNWLDQLPPEVAQDIAYRNAARLFR